MAFSHIKRVAAAALPLPVTINGADRLIVPRANRRYEPEAWAALMPYVTSNSMFVDVGAHIGLYSIAAARRGASVIAFEPDDRNVRKLRALARINRANVTVVPALVGARAGATTFAARGSAVSTQHLMYAGARTRYTVAPVVALDTVLTGQVGAMKIDVEGAEYDVLLGARRTLEDGVSAILVEVHPDALEQAGFQVSDLASVLRDHGYRYEDLPATDGPKRWLATR